jgi:hypothetical protein
VSGQVLALALYLDLVLGHGLEEVLKTKLGLYSNHFILFAI